jgi:hypothetical protein
MGWCCFGRNKWSRRVWSPDGAAHITELSPNFSTTSLIPPGNPNVTEIGSVVPTVVEDQRYVGRQVPEVHRASTFPSLDNLPHHSNSDQSYLQDSSHSPVVNRRRSSDLPVRFSIPPNQVSSTSGLRQRPQRPRHPRPQSVPGQVEMEQSNGYRRSRSSQGFMSSTNIPALVGGQLRSATRSVNNLYEMGTQNSSFYDRLSSRLNEVIDQIDHEVFSGGEYIYGEADVYIPVRS